MSELVGVSAENLLNKYGVVSVVLTFFLFVCILVGYFVSGLILCYESMIYFAIQWKFTYQFNYFAFLFPTLAPHCCMSLFDV